MDDVGVGREPFDWRPLQPVPGKIQHADRYSGVYLPGIRDGAWRQAVLPRTRKHRQRIVDVETRRQRSREPMDILADAGPLPESRSVIDQDVHAARIVTHDKVAKPLAFNRLTRFFRLCYL